jgi:hypothetical protein
MHQTGDKTDEAKDSFYNKFEYVCNKFKISNDNKIRVVNFATSNNYTAKV